MREKGLKCVQYVLRGAAYSALFSRALSKDLKSLSKAAAPEPNTTHLRKPSPSLT